MGEYEDLRNGSHQLLDKLDSFNLFVWWVKSTMWPWCLNASKAIRNQPTSLMLFMEKNCFKNKLPSNQWLCQVPLIGGRWYIIPQLAVYTTYIPLIYWSKNLEQKTAKLAVQMTIKSGQTGKICCWFLGMYLGRDLFLVHTLKRRLKYPKVKCTVPQSTYIELEHTNSSSSISGPPPRSSRDQRDWREGEKPFTKVVRAPLLAGLRVCFFIRVQGRT